MTDDNQDVRPQPCPRHESREAHLCRAGVNLSGATPRGPRPTMPPQNGNRALNAQISIDTHDHLQMGLTPSITGECSFGIDTLNAFSGVGN